LQSINQLIDQSIAQKKQEGGKAVVNRPVAVNRPVVINHLIDRSVTHTKKQESGKAMVDQLQSID